MKFPFWDPSDGSCSPNPNTNSGMEKILSDTCGWLHWRYVSKEEDHLVLKLQNLFRFQLVCCTPFHPYSNYKPLDTLSSNCDILCSSIIINGAKRHENVTIALVLICLLCMHMLWAGTSRYFQVCTHSPDIILITWTTCTPSSHRIWFPLVHRNKLWATSSGTSAAHSTEEGVSGTNICK